MRLKLVRTLFIVTTPLLFVQLFLIKLYDEPYPSVRFPGFSHVYSLDYPQQYVHMLATVRAGNQVATLTMNELLMPTPQYAKAFFTHMEGKVKQLPPQLTLSKAAGKEQEMIRFFERNAIANTDLSEVEEIRFRWYRYTIDSLGATPVGKAIEERVLLVD